MTRIKCCGMTRVEDALLASRLGVDAIGLVFTARSGRQVSLAQAVAIRRALPPFVTTVALFMDDTPALVEEVIATVNPDLLQFHGSESDAECLRFGRPYLKAIAMGDGDSALLRLRDYPGAAALLLDGHEVGEAGGSGKSFDWMRMPRDLTQPVILAGGLRAGNVAVAIHQARPWAVDVASGVESAPGIKDAAMLADFVAAVRAADKSEGVVMSELSGTIPTPAAIEEYRVDDDHPFDLDAVVAGGRPLVIRGLVREWPVVKLARQSDTAFAQRLAELDNGTDVTTLLIAPEGDGIIGYTPDMSGFNYQHFKVSVTMGLRRLASYSRRDKAPGLVIQSVPIRDCLPGFLAEHALPFLDQRVEPRLWMGNKITTPTHFDSQHNIACVVCGTRRFTLFPPEQLPNLYIGPLDYAPTGAAISMARLDQPDDPRFPRLKLALAAAQVAELHPGDAIYMPPLWWHNVESLELLNALVNYWWSPVEIEGYNTGHARAALYHCLLAFRVLPPAERANWRNLLDYYVFGNEEAVAHIPEDRRGVLGPLTDETVEQLKQGARQHL